MFLLGPNGKGKSSIVEAIRWGLFGSTGRRNDVVRNGSYSGECRVVIDLSRDSNEWNLTRVLIPGSGESRPELVDHLGEVRNIRDVMPQIHSLDAGEGAHIIFAAQTAPLGRPPEDLSPFEKTVIGHLGLTDASAFVSHLDTFVKEQGEEETRLARLVDDRRDRLAERISQLQRQRGAILAARPWDGELLPSVAETEDKAKDLIKEIAPDNSDDESGAMRLDALVDKVDRVLEKRIGLDRTPLAENLARLDQDLTELGAIGDILTTIGSKKARLQEAEEARDKDLNGVSLEELRTRFESQHRSAGSVALRRRLGEVAAELICRSDDVDIMSCPICGTDYDRNELGDLISGLSQNDDEQNAAKLRETENQLNAALEADGQVGRLREDLRECEDALSKAVAASGDAKLAAAISGGHARNYFEAVKQQKLSIEKQIDGFEDWLKSVQTRVAKLREEARFQSIQQSLKYLKDVEEEMQSAEQSFHQFVEFGESVRGIQNSVRSTLIQQLRAKAPSVANKLTTVFCALTKHDYSDRLIIDDEKLPKLELLVASSSDTSGTLHPTGVLNGQAESALALVPHFALSQAEEAPTEVYLVLLDDPTRAFDRDHIEILIERLADLGKRVQVVVATQETETFRELLPKFFEQETYVVVEPQDWSPIDGPTLVIQ